MCALNNNQPPLPGIFPDYAALIVTMENGVRIMQDARWSVPSSRKALLDAATKRADKLRAKGKEVDFDQPLRMEPDLAGARGLWLEAGSVGQRLQHSLHGLPKKRPLELGGGYSGRRYQRCLSVEHNRISNAPWNLTVCRR